MGNDDDSPLSQQSPLSRLYQTGLSGGALTTTEASKEESVGEFLRRKELGLMQRAAAVRGMLRPLEAQLDEVRTAMKAIGIEPAGSAVADMLDYAENAEIPYATKVPEGVAWEITHSQPTGVIVLTIKQMILYALRDHFREAGASPTDLKNYVMTVYERHVDRNSISPQLTRLREQGLVVQVGVLNEGKWALTKAGRRYSETLGQEP